MNIQTHWFLHVIPHGRNWTKPSIWTANSSHQRLKKVMFAFSYVPLLEEHKTALAVNPVEMVIWLCHERPLQYCRADRISNRDSVCVCSTMQASTGTGDKPEEAISLGLPADVLLVHLNKGKFRLCGKSSMSLPLTTLNMLSLHFHLFIPKF